MTKRRSSGVRTPQKPKITLATSFFISPSKRAPDTAITYVGSTTPSSNRKQRSTQKKPTTQPSSHNHVEEKEVDSIEFSDHEGRDQNSDNEKSDKQHQGLVSSLTILKQQRKQEEKQKSTEIKTPERNSSKKSKVVTTTPQKKQLSLDKYAISPVTTSKQQDLINNQTAVAQSEITLAIINENERKNDDATSTQQTPITTSTGPRKDPSRRIISSIVHTPTPTTTSVTSDSSHKFTVSTTDGQRLQSIMSSRRNTGEHAANGRTESSPRVPVVKNTSMDSQKHLQQLQQNLSLSEQQAAPELKSTEATTRTTTATTITTTTSERTANHDDITKAMTPSLPSSINSNSSSQPSLSQISDRSIMQPTSTAKHAPSYSSAQPTTVHSVTSEAQNSNKPKIASGNSISVPKSTNKIVTHVEQPAQNAKPTSSKLASEKVTQPSTTTTKSATTSRTSTSKSTAKPKIILASQVSAHQQLQPQVQAQQTKKTIVTASATTNNNKKRSSSDARKGNKRGRKKRRVDSDYETSENSETDDEVIVATKHVSSGGRSTRSGTNGQRPSSTRMSRSALTELEQHIEDALDQTIQKMVSYYEKIKRNKRNVYHSGDASDESGGENGESDEEVFIPPSSYMDNIDLNISDSDGENAQQSKRLFVARWPNRDICVLSGHSTEDALSKLEDTAETSGAVIIPFNGDIFFDFKLKRPLYEDASKSKTIDIGEIPYCSHHLLDNFLSGTFSDLELQVKGKKFKVHKIVLSQYPYFTEKSLQDCSRISLDALGFTPNVIKLILIQMYTFESIPLPHITSDYKFQMWKSLLVAATSFGLLRLKVMLERAIAEQLDLCSLTTGLSNGGLYSTNPFNGVVGSIPKNERIQFIVDTANFAVRHDAHKLLRYLLSNLSKHCQISELQEAQLDPDLIERVKNWKPSDNQVWNKGFADHMNLRYDYELKAASTGMGNKMWQEIEQKLFPASASIRPRSKRTINSKTRKQRLKNAITREDDNAFTEYSQRRDENIENNFDLNQYAPILLRIAGDNENTY